MLIPREVMKRREAEFEAARTKAEVDALHEKWRREDDAAARADDWRSRQFADQGRRIARLETLFLHPNGKRYSDSFHEVLAQAIVTVCANMLEDRRVMTYGGVWDEGKGYAAGTMVTTAGGAWVAVAAAAPGDRPGRAPAWKLMAKGEAKEPTVR